MMTRLPYKQTFEISPSKREKKTVEIRRFGLRAFVRDWGQRKIERATLK